MPDFQGYFTISSIVATLSFPTIRSHTRRSDLYCDWPSIVVPQSISYWLKSEGETCFKGNAFQNPGQSSVFLAVFAFESKRHFMELEKIDQ